MDSERRLGLVARNLEEIVTLDELKSLLETNEKPRAYIGYEPSGLVHIGWLIWMLKARDLVEAGLDFIVLEATWHAYINDKLGGDMDLIRSAADLVRKVLESIGLPESRVTFIDAEKLASDKDYWGLVIRVLKNASLARVKRALTIMGRRADEAELDSSKIIYPAMQVADIFYLDLDVAMGGMDQRKAHMLARDLSKKLGFKKPVAIHTPILTGLQGVSRMEQGVEVDELYVEAKMSKSVPGTAIWVHDEPEHIESKLRKAYCPPRETRFNPVLEINKFLLFQQEGFKLEVDRPAKYGGPVEFHSYGELEEAYAKGDLHPLDLKNATARALSEMLEPIRRALKSDKRTVELIKILSGKVTR